VTFGNLPPHEVNRRLKKSRAAWREILKEEWLDGYQATCDKIYWSKGKCCAGCDHWASDGGLTGACAAAGIVSGEQVLKSMGISMSSYIPAPGFPITDHTFVCGLFRDNFDWTSLSPEYLAEIGALRDGILREKP
jgi:hypothetical protein